jgi:hypothetical protein
LIFLAMKVPAVRCNTVRSFGNDAAQFSRA